MWWRWNTYMGQRPKKSELSGWNFGTESYYHCNILLHRSVVQFCLFICYILYTSYFISYHHNNYLYLSESVAAVDLLHIGRERRIIRLMYGHTQVYSSSWLWFPYYLVLYIMLYFVFFELNSILFFVSFCMDSGHRVKSLLPNLSKDMGGTLDQSLF